MVSHSLQLYPVHFKGQYWQPERGKEGNKAKEGRHIFIFTPQLIESVDAESTDMSGLLYRSITIGKILKCQITVPLIAVLLWTGTLFVLR